MKEYNLKDSTIGTDLPAQYGTLKKIKNFFRLDLTEKQEKVFGQVHDFLFQEVEFSELKELMYQEVNFTEIKNFWLQEVDFGAIKDFWLQDVKF